MYLKNDFTEIYAKLKKISRELIPFWSNIKPMGFVFYFLFKKYSVFDR